MPHKHADRRNVRQRVQRAHFVEMDFRDGPLMDLALRLRDQPVDRHDILLDGFRQCQMVHDKMLDVVHGAVVVAVFMVMLMSVFVVMLVFMLMVMMVRLVAFDFSVHGDDDMGSADAAFHGVFPPEGDFRDADGVQRVDLRIGIREEFQQGGGHHVAGRAHAAVQIQCLHFFVSMWLMRLAR